MYHSGNQLVDPHVLFDKARLHEGMHVADFGCGRTGHIVFPAAVIIGERGMVYAVDILKEVLEQIDKRAKLESLLHVHTVWSNLEKAGGTAIPAGTLDVVFIVNMLFHAQDKSAVLTEAKRLLKDKARVVIVDWVKNSLPFGPRENEFIDFEDIRRWAKTAGMGIQEEFAVGQYHWGIVLYQHV